MVEKLPVGITKVLNSWGLKQFRTDCYEVARTIYGRRYAKILDVREGGLYRNYYLCHMQLREHHHVSIMNIVILQNHSYQMLAFSSTQEMPFIFLNVPLLQTAFEALGYEVLSKDYLESEPTPQDIADLSDQELKDYRYWKPGRIGEIIFNHWD